MRKLDNAAMLFKIDGTTPRNDPAEVSYRYPFMRDGEYIAPIAYDDWDNYQGNSAGAQAAVRRLLAKVKAEFSNFGRAPK